MEHLPHEIQRALKELDGSYENFEYDDRGANGYVVFATNNISRTEVAIKFYSGEPGERCHDEPRLLAKIDSPNVVTIYDARVIEGDWAFFVTKRCREGDLDDFIATRPSVHRAIDVAMGICGGAGTIHSCSMVHRDLKPANIIMDGTLPKIADFGSVRRLENGKEFVPASRHSVLYRPPESFETDTYSIKGDVYQIGLVTFQLLGGCLPYDPFAYFTRADMLGYQKLSDQFDRSKFQDAVIRKRAQNGTLANLNSLQPWFGRRARQALRQMTHPDPAQRCRSMADVAASLLQIRASTNDWSIREDGIVCLPQIDRKIELRPLAGGDYEPQQSKGGAFRRIPNLQNAALDVLIRMIDET